MTGLTDNIFSTPRPPAGQLYADSGCHVRISLHLGVDGHRSDLTLIKAAEAYAAMQMRTEVYPSDVTHVAKLVMPHRMRRNPFQDSNLNSEELDAWLKSTFGTN